MAITEEAGSDIALERQLPPAIPYPALITRHNAPPYTGSSAIEEVHYGFFVHQNPWTKIDPLGLDGIAVGGIYIGTDGIGKYDPNSYHGVGGVREISFDTHRVATNIQHPLEFFGGMLGHGNSEAAKQGGEVARNLEAKLDILMLLEAIEGGPEPGAPVPELAPSGNSVVVVAPKAEELPIVFNSSSGSTDPSGPGGKVTKSEAIVTRKIPDSKLKYRPSERGRAPVGEDDRPVELHHLDQSQGNDSPRAEMTRTDHRGKGNYSKNHTNTGSMPSTVDRAESGEQHVNHWKKEWDSGRFKDIPEKPNKNTQ